VTDGYFAVTTNSSALGTGTVGLTVGSGAALEMSGRHYGVEGAGECGWFGARKERREGGVARSDRKTARFP